MSGMHDLMNDAFGELDKVPDGVLPSVRLEAALRRCGREIEEYVRLLDALTFLRARIRELEKRAREIEEDLAERLAPLADEVAAVEGLKEVTVSVHDGVVFVKPRKETEVVVVDDEADLHVLKEMGYARLKTVIEPDKRAIKAALKAGRAVPWCKIEKRRGVHIGYRRGKTKAKAPLPEPQKEETSTDVTDLDEIVWD